MPQEFENIKVQSLLVSGENKWDEEVLNDIFNGRDGELIKRIPLPAISRHDSWFWILDEKGIFTVKSCYRMIQGEHGTPYSVFWKKLWSMKVPGKVLNFLWRVCSSCLPTAVALTAKHVQMNVRCPWCHAGDEDDVHVLFSCEFAKSVWATSGVNDIIQVLPGEKVFDILQRIFSAGTREQLVLVALMCWNLWNRRNKWVWEKINVSGFGVRQGAMNLLSDWRNVQQEVTRNVVSSNTSLGHWSKPPSGWVKVNIDAASFEELNCTGVGAVIRDEQGEFVRARSRRIEVLLHPREAEALSLKEALSWVKELGFRDCVFETDAKQLADACRNIQGASYFHTIVSDCVEYCKHFDNVLVQFVGRSANVVAHKLARATYSMSDVKVWVNTPPEFILESLVYDSI